jgi:hypothetical protein
MEAILSEPDPFAYRKMSSWQYNRGKEGSGSFLKKRTKKLLFVWAEPIRKSRSQKQPKVFCFFFSKKKSLP